MYTFLFVLSYDLDRAAKYNNITKVDLIFTKKGKLDSQPQVIKFTSYLPMVGGSLRVLRPLPPLKLVAMI
jgi:hypothetical protein